MSEASSFLSSGKEIVGLIGRPPATSEFRGTSPILERPVFTPPPPPTNDNLPPRIPKRPVRWPALKFNPGKTVRSVVLASAAIWLAPQIVPFVCHMQASAYYDQGQYAQAVDYDAVGLNWAVTPGAKANLLMWRGYDFLFSDQYTAARLDFTASVKLNPTVPKDTADIYWMAQPPNAYKGLFWTNFESGRYSAALAECNRMIAIAPNDAENYAIRGKCLRGLGQYQAAEREFDYVLSRNPQMLFAYYHLADMQQKNLHDPPAALATMQRAVRFMPGDADAWGMLGWQQYVSDDYAGALKTDEKSLAINDASSQDYVRSNMALIFAVEGNWRLAEPLYRIVASDGDAPAIRGALPDIEDALKKQPGSLALQQAKVLISNTPAVRQSGGESDDEP